MHLKHGSVYHPIHGWQGFDPRNSHLMLSNPRRMELQCSNLQPDTTISSPPPPPPTYRPQHSNLDENARNDIPTSQSSQPTPSETTNTIAESVETLPTNAGYQGHPLPPQQQRLHPPPPPPPPQTFVPFPAAGSPPPPIANGRNDIASEPALLLQQLLLSTRRKSSTVLPSPPPTTPSPDHLKNDVTREVKRRKWQQEQESLLQQIVQRNDKILQVSREIDVLDKNIESRKKQATARR